VFTVFHSYCKLEIIMGTELEVVLLLEDTVLVFKVDERGKAL
jgi:hypothetical protein